MMVRCSFSADLPGASQPACSIALPLKRTQLRFLGTGVHPLALVLRLEGRVVLRGTSFCRGGALAAEAEAKEVEEAPAAAMVQLDSYFERQAASATPAQKRRDLLPLLSRLATALQAVWALPYEQAQARWEAAQAAAARSCAFLRCASVDRGGGPAAGKGEGSLRCSGCHAVW